MQLIQPKFVKSFNCLADKCPSTCCREWNITWRESELQRLASCTDNGIKEKIPEAFYKNGVYYSIKHGEDGYCPFLLDNGLCGIHKNAGEQYLSYVCREYPRIARAVGDTIIKTCKTACFHVMDMILSDTQCMTTEQGCAADTMAIITPDSEISRRSKLFHNYSYILKRDSLPYYNKEKAKRLFTEIFGFELLTADTEDPAAEMSLARAVFLELMINGFRPEASDEANRRCLELCLDWVRLALSGAVRYSESRSQLVLTMCDISSFLLSKTAVITEYLSQRI